MTVVLGRPHPIQVYAGDRDRSPFATGDLRRPLRIAIDRSSVAQSTELDLLLELRDGRAEVWSTAAEDLDATITVGEPASGWHGDSIPVTTQYSDGRRAFTGIWPRSQWERQITAHAAATHQSVTVVKSRFLAAAALMERVDALVVGDLDFGPSRLAARANPMSPASACALIGLVARLNGDYDIAPIPRSFFHFLVTRGLLSEGWRWFSACVASSLKTGDDYLVNVGQSAHERIGRAIMSRDRCLGHAFGGDGDASAEEAAYYFDVELLMLSGALDAVAQVAHIAHDVAEDSWNVGWRRARWRQALRKRSALLWTLTEPGTAERDAIELVALLRNTIHGGGMPKVTVGNIGAVANQLVVSERLAEDLARILNRHGGAERWGLTLDRSPTLAPAPFAQLIIPLVVAAANSLMRATEVEKLPGAVPSKLPMDAPVNERLFEPALTRRLLLLTGLAP